MYVNGMNPIDKSRCGLVLYYQDTRISEKELSASTELSFSKQPAEKIYSVINGYFQVDRTWDKKLLKTVLSCEVNFNEFKFVRKNSPEVICGMNILSNKDLVLIDKQESFNASNHKGRAVSVTSIWLGGVNQHNFTFENLNRDVDPCIVALYNSETCIKLDCGSKEHGFTYLLETTK